MTDPIAYLRRRDPVDSERLGTPPFEAAHGLADDIMARDRQRYRSASRGTRQQRRGRILAVPMVAAAVAIIALVGVLRVSSARTPVETMGPDATPDRALPTAQQVAQAVNDGGRVQVTIDEASGVTSVRNRIASFAVERRRVVKTIDATGWTVSITTSLPTQFLTPEDRQQWIASGELLQQRTQTNVSRQREPAMTPPGVAASPASVRARIDQATVEQAHWPKGAAAMVTARDILAASTVDLQAQANVREALSSIDGVTVRPGPTRPDGSPTTIASAESDHTGARSRTELRFDAAGRYIGSREILLEKQTWTAAKPPVVLQSYEVTGFEILPAPPTSTTP